ncbi:MAG: YHYH protein, partial [Chloroflexota bacterium]
TYMNEETTTLVRIYVDGDTRYFETNVLPDHETGNFPNPGNPHTLSAQDLRFTTPAEPEVADEITEVGLGKFGLALNGVPFEREAAEWYNRDRDSGWQYDAFGGGVQLGFDLNNAHVQPSGLYHYHGVPDALIAEEDPEEHPLLVGYAGDGFPIYLYYSYEDPEDTDSDIISLTPSYQLREGNRNGGPGGTFDGTFNEDWEYVEGSGDLDECNGRTGSTPDYPDGTYYYVLTEAFPRVPTCWSGTIGEGWSPPQPGRR